MKNFVCMMLFLCVHNVYTCTIQEERCEQTYQSPSGLTCSYCAPGTYKVEDCKTNYTSALCSTCPKNTYQRNCNRAESCASCDYRCPDRFKKVKNCTMYEDIICVCKDGYFKADGVCINSTKARTVNPAYKPTQTTEWYNSSTVNRQNRPTQTKTEWYNSSTVHTQNHRPTQTTEWYNSSTANMPKQTKEGCCNGCFKVRFIILVSLISLTLSILLVCVFIYVSGQGEQVQKLWKNCSCCSNCSKAPPDHQKKPTPAEEEDEVSDKISQKKPNPALKLENQKKPNPALKLEKQKKPIPAEEQDEQKKPIPAEEQDEVNVKISFQNLSSTEKRENQESVPDYSEEAPLMTENKTKQSNVNGNSTGRVVSISETKSQQQLFRQLSNSDEKNSSEMKHF